MATNVAVNNFRCQLPRRLLLPIQYDSTVKTLRERLEFLAKKDALDRGELHPNLHEIARGAELKAGTVTMLFSRLQNGKAKGANTKTLTALARYFRCNYEWLATGKGDPFSESMPIADTPTEKVSKLSDLPHYAVIERSARKLAPSLDDDVWSVVRDRSPFLPPDTHLSAGALAEYAMLLAKFVTPKP